MQNAMRAGARAYRALRDEIIEWQMPPGAPLAELDLAERLGMSRTPVREALARLVEEGLVVTVGGRGLEVAPFDRERVRDLYALREALESQAVRLAARRGHGEEFLALAEEFAQVPATFAAEDPDRVAYYALIARFDASVDVAADNDYLAAALRAVRAHAARVRRAARRDPVRLLAAAAEHAEIARAISAGDGDLAVHATCLHLHRSLEHALASTLTRAHASAGSLIRPEDSFVSVEEPQ